MGVFALDI